MKKKWIYLLIAIILLLAIGCAAYFFRSRIKYEVTKKISVQEIDNCKDINFCGLKNKNIEITGYLVKMDSTNYVLFDQPWSSELKYEGLFIKYFEGYNSSLDKLKNHKVKANGKIVGQSIAGNGWSAILPALSVNGISDITLLD
jgi:hypothetical protein